MRSRKTTELYSTYLLLFPLYNGNGSCRTWFLALYPSKSEREPLATLLFAKSPKTPGRSSTQYAGRVLALLALEKRTQTLP